MPEPFDFDVSVNPRGSETGKQFELRFTEEAVVMEGPSRKEARCEWRERVDPEWSGYMHPAEHPVNAILEHEGAYPPTAFAGALEHLWKMWRGGEITKAELRTEVETLVDWVNATTGAWPNTRFWRPIF